MVRITATDSCYSKRWKGFHAHSSNLTPNEDEMNWEAANTTYFMPFKPGLVVQDEADGELGACEDASARTTGGDATKTAGILSARSSRLDLEDLSGSLGK